MTYTSELDQPRDASRAGWPSLLLRLARKLLLKLDHVHMILANHTADEFPCLAVEANFRLRTPTPSSRERNPPHAGRSIAGAACREAATVR